MTHTEAIATARARKADPPRGWRPPPVLMFVLRRVLVAIPTLLVVTILVFVVCQLLPGDIVASILGRNADPAAVADMTARLGLDRPPAQRYLEWLAGMVQGDFGTSATGILSGRTGDTVLNLVLPKLGNSLVLAGLALVALVPLSLVVGVVAAMSRRRSVDKALSYSAITLIAFPDFLVATILILVFAVLLGWLPAVSFVIPGDSVWTDPTILILPALTLLAASFAQMMRMVRAGVLDVSNAGYVETARLYGLRPRRIVLQYILRNTLAPTVQVLALTMQWLIGGIILIEAVFGYPGIGNALVTAVSARDIPLVQGVVVIIAAAYILINIVADVAVTFLVPKLRTTLFQG
jgi:peptide/nickel transport system permease protein